MEIKINDNQKLVEIRLTNAEKNAPKVEDNLKPLYAKYKEREYTVVIFKSGTENLYDNTLELLKHNKMKMTELATQKQN